MREPRFGIVFKADTFDSIAMFIGPHQTVSRGERNWTAVVLSDKPDSTGFMWAPGEIITIAPDGDFCVEIEEEA